MTSEYIEDLEVRNLLNSLLFVNIYVFDVKIKIILPLDSEYYSPI